MLMTGGFASRSAPRRVLMRLLLALMAVLAGGIVVMLASSTPATAEPRGLSDGLTFNGGFTPDTLRPWNDLNLSDSLMPLPPIKPALRHGRHAQPIRIVRAPGRERRLWAARFTVTPQRHFLEGATYMERSEIMASPAQTGALAGHSAWYGWASYFPRGFKATPHHYTVIAQVHSIAPVCLPPNLYVVVNTQPPVASGGEIHAISLITYGGPVIDGLTAAVTGCAGGIQEHQFVLGQYQARHWYRFVMHVMWSGDPTIGYVELWINGRLVLPFTHVPTLYSSSPAYWKQGLYETGSQYAASAYELGVRVGSSYAAVAY